MVIALSSCRKKSNQDEGKNPDVEYSANPWTDGEDLYGTTVSLFGAFVDEDASRFNESIRIFEDQTGIDLVYEGSGDFETLITVRTEGGDPPDITSYT